MEGVAGAEDTAAMVATGKVRPRAGKGASPAVSAAGMTEPHAQSGPNKKMGRLHGSPKSREETSPKEERRAENSSTALSISLSARRLRSCRESSSTRG
jgi:hypothetical protein